MREGLVSIIVPVYNVEKFLRECLESILSQTYTNIEIICVEDCSTDNSLNILNEYVFRDNRIRLVKNEQNQGLASARNIGIGAANGEYILFVDSDDRIDLNLLSTVMQYAEGREIVAFNYRKLYEDTQKTETFPYKVEDGDYSGKDLFAKEVEAKCNIIAAWAKLYRRSFLEKYNLRFKEGILFEDVLFYVDCFQRANYVYRITQDLYDYRVRENSIVTMTTTHRHVESQFINLCELVKRVYSGENVDAVSEFLFMILGDFIRLRNLYGIDNEVSFLSYEEGSQYEKAYHLSSQIYVIQRKIKCLDKVSLERLRIAKYIIVYGAGGIATEIVQILNDEDLCIHGVAVTSQRNDDKKTLMGHRIQEIQAYEEIKDDCIVVVAVTNQYAESIVEHLEELGFKNFIRLDVE